MDINFLRGLATLLLFISFIALCFWVFSKNRRKEFEQAANLPFVEDIHDTYEPKSQDRKHRRDGHSSE